MQNLDRSTHNFYFSVALQNCHASNHWSFSCTIVEIPNN